MMDSRILNRLQCPLGIRTQSTLARPDLKELSSPDVAKGAVAAANKWFKNPKDENQVGSIEMLCDTDSISRKRIEPFEYTFE